MGHVADRLLVNTTGALPGAPKPLEVNGVGVFGTYGSSEILLGMNANATDGNQHEGISIYIWNSHGYSHDRRNYRYIKGKI